MQAAAVEPFLHFGAVRLVHALAVELLDEVVDPQRHDRKAVGRAAGRLGVMAGRFAGQDALGREQVDQYWKQSPASAEWKLEVLEVGGDRETPWVRGVSTLQSQSGRRMVTEYVGLLRRQPDNALKFYVDIYTSASPTPVRTPGGVQ